MVEVDEFARGSGAFVDALVALDVPAPHVAPARRLRDDALKAANGAPLFRGIIGHFLQQLRGMGLFPQSHAERAYRGNDARLFPWGDATARRPSLAAFQYLGFLPAPAPMPSVPRLPYGIRWVVPPRTVRDA